MHTWLIVLKAFQSMGRYLWPPILKRGLGDSDFRVLELLLHKGPTPVNALGPKVNLNPGSVSVAVDRLYKKGLVSRVECPSDRRVRTVSITPKGREFFVPLFREHVAFVKHAFEEISLEDQKKLQLLLKKLGKHAEVLAQRERSDPRRMGPLAQRGVTR